MTGHKESVMSKYHERVRSYVKRYPDKFPMCFMVESLSVHDWDRPIKYEYNVTHRSTCTECDVDFFARRLRVGEVNLESPWHHNIQKVIPATSSFWKYEDERN